MTKATIDLKFLPDTAIVSGLAFCHRAPDFKGESTGIDVLHDFTRGETVAELRVALEKIESRNPAVEITFLKI